MSNDRQILLSYLPKKPYTWVKVTERQSVPDIIAEVLKQHKANAADYDLIAGYFDGYTVPEICANLYDFCKKNIRYKEETEAFQTVGNPRSILERAQSGVDCKSYASFIAGCLDSLSRQTGKTIDWCYRFASYDPLQPVPYHVFAVVKTDAGELYIDPTPGADGKEPFYILDKTPRLSQSQKVGRADCGCPSVVGAAIPYAPPAGYTLIPAPSWYPDYLPKFYRDSSANVLLRPINSVASFTQDDVYATMLYWQTIVGYNRQDISNAKNVAWQTSNGQSGETWVRSAFKKDANGDGGGNFANIPSGTTNGALYSNLQQAYVKFNATQMPWLKDMQAKGGGIDLMTIPMSTDIEIPRPSWYLPHLPSLFKSAGQPFQMPAGFLETKPKILNWKSSGYTVYTITAKDVAALMLYAQPVIALGPTPYPVNWYINDVVNGAVAMRFKISLATDAGFTDSQEQSWGVQGDIMKLPPLDADPYASGFTKTLQSVVSFAVSFFAGKIPGGTSLMKASSVLAAAGGQAINGGSVSPAGTFSEAVFNEANAFAKQLGIDPNTGQLTSATKTKRLLAALLAASFVGIVVFYDDLKNYKI